MDGIKILGAGHAFGDELLTNDALSQVVETSDEWIQSRTGIQARRICQKTDCLAMASKAASSALDQAGISAMDLDVLIAATLSFEKTIPSLACSVAARLGIEKSDLLAFDINSACTGFLHGIQCAAALLKNGQKALVLAAERLSSHVDWTDRGTCILFGDGAGAVVLEKREDSFFYAFSGTEPDTIGGLSLAKPGKIEMSGSDIFRFATRVMPKAIDRVLTQAGADVGDVDLIIPHQANARIIDHVKR
ncbi:MAG: beta-ketoacyl-ACP synthase 3, partial [Ileibacterium sp.]|nr:beta-ketoacyl-ACP synthase 3 [Ileibacterium sp.]